MKADAIAYVIAGMCFGVILGWVIGTQQARRPGASPAVQTAAADQSAGNTETRPAPTLDEGRVQALTTIIKSDPTNADAVVQLANTYFDAERWDEAIQYYKRAIELDPKNADASTDLGVSLYYTNKADEALAQFEHSLKINPKHTKTLLNKGIVLAFGKQDLNAAQAAWEQVVTLAPDSPEGQAASRALQGIKAAHAGGPPAGSQ